MYMMFSQLHAQWVLPSDIYKIKGRVASLRAKPTPSSCFLLHNVHASLSIHTHIYSVQRCTAVLYNVMLSVNHEFKIYS